MIYLCVLLIMASSAALGKFLSSSIIMRDKFFTEMKQLCEHFKNNISFMNEKVSKLYEGYSKKSSGEFRDLILELKNISKRKDKSKALSKAYFLKKEEKNFIVNFASSLGTSDEASQLNLIENFKTFINAKSDEASKKRKEQGSLYLKVCLGVGAVICILII